MKHLRLTWLLAAVVMAMPLRGAAQVDRVVAEAEGITWASCAAVMEIALRRLDGVDKIAISIEKQLFAVTYKPGASFRPKELRDAVAQADVKVVRFHLSATGQVQQDGDRKFFLAGKDRFLLLDSGKQLPAGGAVGIMAIVDDSKNPMELKVDDFKPARQQAPAGKALP